MNTQVINNISHHLFTGKNSVDDSAEEYKATAEKISEDIEADLRGMLPDDDFIRIMDDIMLCNALLNEAHFQMGMKTGLKMAMEITRI